MQTVTVLKAVKGKFGPQVQTNFGFMSFSKFYKGAMPLDPGIYQMDVYTTEKGNMYINESVAVPGETHPAPTVKRPFLKKEVLEDIALAEDTKDSVSKTSLVGQVAMLQHSSFKPRDFDAEARGKTRCALMEALFSNPNVVDSETKTVEHLFQLVTQAVDFVFQDKV